MLAKLIKHELVASGRIMLPMFVLVAVLTILNSITIHFSRLEILNGLIATIYGLALMVMFILTAVVIIYRFYKNLTTDEGYLMFTLPVRPWQLVLSKLLCALIWTVACSVVMILTLFVIGGSGISTDLIDVFPVLAQGLSEANAATGGQIPALIIEFILACLIGAAATILQVYVAIALGQLFNKSRVAAAVGFYIGISIVLQILAVALMLGGAMALQSIPMLANAIEAYAEGLVDSGSGAVNAATTLQWFFNMTTLWNAVLSVIFFFTTTTIFKRRLNLE